MELVPRSRSMLERPEEQRKELLVHRLIQDSHSWDTLLVEDSCSIGMGRPRKDHTCSYTWFTDVCTLLPEIKRIRKKTISCKIL